ncbi:FCS-LIKE ZINC FINGER 8 [Salix viminalis]|uniref:FCS-LIKE ZINC FINGER 8 n=1 Tax=Salix viminalis TaxID=40686 RepID=A0A9Q0UTJ9_SALVM|nr:FCS-LIKE ZINC FINGER 8 [Salix viminalis]
MLRNRSRAVTSKQTLMTEHSTQSPSTQNYTKPATSFLSSPRFKAFTFKGLPEAEPMMSPTSILDTTKPLFPFKTPFSYDINQPKSPKVFSQNKHSWDKPDSKGIGVALIDETPVPSCIRHIKEDDNHFSKPSNRMVLFGTKLKVQIPPVPNSVLSPVQSPESPGDFGIKTCRNSQLSASGSVNSSFQAKDSPQVVAGCISMSEMELSEDYTCIITHGPNPKTTHIFYNCIVENLPPLSDTSKSVPKSFLSFCYTCKKNLEQKNDIYIYRGEKAFCSQECRYQEMLLDEVET